MRRVKTLRYFLSIGIIVGIYYASRDEQSPAGLEAVYDTERYRISVSGQSLEIFDREYQQTVFGSDAEFLLSSRRGNTSKSPHSLNWYQTAGSCRDAVIDRAEPYSNYMLITGHFTTDDCNLSFYLRLFAGNESVRIAAATSDETYNQLRLGYLRPVNEHIFGFGANGTKQDFADRQVEPFGQLAENSSEEFSTTAVITHSVNTPPTPPKEEFFPGYVSNLNHTITLSNHGKSIFDFREPGRSFIHSFDSSLQLDLVSCRPTLSCISYRRQSYDFNPDIPDWIHSGITLGISGGSEKVLRAIEQVQEAKLPLSSVWIQDWSGQHALPSPRQDSYWQNWEADPVLYNDWNSLVEQLSKEKLHVIGNITGALEDTSQKPYATQDFFSDAQRQGFLVENNKPTQENSKTPKTTSAIIDFSNPSARAWAESHLLEQLSQSPINGWTASIQPPLPTGAQLHDKTNAETGFTGFFADWIHLHRKLTEKLPNTPAPVALIEYQDFYPRKTRKITHPNHGLSYRSLQKALIATINGGASGLASLQPGVLPRFYSDFASTSEQHNLLENDNATTGSLPHHSLVQQWLALSSFFPIYRTNDLMTQMILLDEGNSEKPADENLFLQLKKSSYIYQRLRDYRLSLVEEMRNNGWPMLRSPTLSFPNDERFFDLPEDQLQFMLGPYIMVAPILQPKNKKMYRSIYLPKGHWIDLWTGEPLQAPGEGTELKVRPTPGQPPVYILVTPESQRLVLDPLKSVMKQ